MSSAPILLAPGLYEISAGGADPAIFVYFLAVNDITADVTLDQLFNVQDFMGWYVFMPLEIANPEDFKTEARLAFPKQCNVQYQPANNMPRGIVWLPDPEFPGVFTDSLVFAQNNPSYPVRVLGSSFTFQWSATFGLAMAGSQVSVAFDDISAQLILGSPNPGDIQIYYGSFPVPVGSYAGGWNIQLPVIGPLAGALQFQAGLDLGTMQQTFGCGFTYFYPNGSTYATLTYPLFPPVPVTQRVGQGSTFLGFNARLDPLYPLEASRTRLALDLSGGGSSQWGPIYSGNSLQLSSVYFSAINGGAMTMVPRDPGLLASPSVGSPSLDSNAAAFAFCMAPAAGAPSGVAPGLGDSSGAAGLA